MRGRQARVSPRRRNFDHDIDKTLLCDSRTSNDLPILPSVASCNAVSAEQPCLTGLLSSPPSSSNIAYPFSPNIFSSSDANGCAPCVTSTLSGHASSSPYICSTALLVKPRGKYHRPSWLITIGQHGLHRRPTMISNIEQNDHEGILQYADQTTLVVYAASSPDQVSCG